MTFGRTLQDTYKIKTVDRPYYSLGYLVKPSPYWRIVYELRPSLNITFLGKKVRTNSYGWREKEFTDKGNDTFRIVGIGDSYMFGWAVDEEDRYMDLLEGDLNSKVHENSFETLVLAVPGYNFAIEESVLETYGRSLDPDIVIYDFTANDFCLPNFIAPARGFWSMESFIILYARKASGKEYDLYNTDDSGNLVEGICSPELAPPPYDQMVGKENFEKALSNFPKNDGGAKAVLLVAIPTALDKDMSSWMHNLSVTHPGINFIFLDESTRYLSDHKTDFWHSDLVIGKGDYHYSEKGNMLVAQWLAEELIMRNLTTKNI